MRSPWIPVSGRIFVAMRGEDRVKIGRSIWRGVPLSASGVQGDKRLSAGLWKTGLSGSVPLLACLLINLPASAQNSESDAGETEALSLEPVVISETRTPRPVSELTRSVTVIDREEMDEQSLLDRNLGDILGKSVPGLSTGTQSSSNYGQTLRGRNFQVLTDGVPLSTPLRKGYRSLNSIGSDAIERVEVVRGGTAAYGFGASGGLMQVITRQPEEGSINAHSEAGLRFSTEHPGDSLEWDTAHRLSGRVNQVDYLLSGNFVQRHSYFDAEGDRIAPDPYASQGGLADSNEYNVLGKLGLNFDEDQQRLELSVNRYYLRQDSDYTYEAGNLARGEKTTARRGNRNAKDPGTENTIVNLNYSNEDAFGSQLKVQAYYNDLVATFGKEGNFTQTELRSEKYGARATVDTPLEVGSFPFNLTWGLDFLRDKTEQPGLDGRTTVPEMEQFAFAGFAEVEVPIADYGLLRGGVRQEHIRLDVDSVVNANNNFVEGSTLSYNETLFNGSGVAFLTDEVELFGSYSQSFSVADMGNVIRGTSADKASDLKGEAQKVDNYELGVRGNFEMFSGSLAGFYNSSDNGVTYGPDYELIQQPEKIWGVEASLDVRPAERWNVGGTFTWMQGEQETAGGRHGDLPSYRVPPVKATGYVEYSPFDWWTTRLQGLYSGNRRADLPSGNHEDIDDYVVFDLYNSFDVGPGQLDLGISNLFNEDYFPVISQSNADGDFPNPNRYSMAKGRMVSLRYSLTW